MVLVEKGQKGLAVFRLTSNHSSINQIFVKIFFLTFFNAERNLCNIEVMINVSKSYLKINTFRMVHPVRLINVLR